VPLGRTGKRDLAKSLGIRRYFIRTR
jgi:hypothetical protein